jgi:hypothetical protein
LIMADRPIIFSAPMVRALLDGRKSQTRRILKDAPEEDWFCDRGSVGLRWVARAGSPSMPRRVPYAAGDRLYVREHWKTMALHDKISPSVLGERYRAGIRRDAAACPVLCLADGHRQGGWADPAEEAESDGWKPGHHRQAMHMPRWASRLTLVVDDVRVERLQAISRDDALAEGLAFASNAIEEFWRWPEPHHENLRLSPPAAYRHLWTELNGPDAWEANPSSPTTPSASSAGTSIRSRGRHDCLTRQLPLVLSRGLLDRFAGDPRRFIEANRPSTVVQRDGLKLARNPVRIHTRQLARARRYISESPRHAGQLCLRRFRPGAAAPHKSRAEGPHRWSDNFARLRYPSL